MHCKSLEMWWRWWLLRHVWRTRLWCEKLHWRRVPLPRWKVSLESLTFSVCHQNFKMIVVEWTCRWRNVVGYVRVCNNNFHTFLLRTKYCMGETQLYAIFTLCFYDGQVYFQQADLWWWAAVLWWKWWGWLSYGLWCQHVQVWDLTTLHSSVSHIICFVCFLSSTVSCTSTFLIIFQLNELRYLWLKNAFPSCITLQTSMIEKR